MKKYLFSSIMLLFLINGHTAFAQCASDILPLSSMFVQKSTTIERSEAFFLDTPSKFELLSTVNDKQDLHVVYTQKAISKLFSTLLYADSVSGIRAYFALFEPEINKASTLPLKRSQLIVLYASEIKSKREGKFLFIHANDDSVYTVEESAAEIWIQNYMSKNQPSLRRSIDAQDLGNRDDTKEGYSDTRSIYFRNKQIDSAFRQEEEYQLKNHQIKITGYLMSFSAYTKEGNGKGEYKNRLHLQFNYLYEQDKTRKILYQDDQDDYKCRLDKTTKVINGGSKTKLRIFGINNGQLCPTHCPTSTLKQ